MENLLALCDQNLRIDIAYLGVRKEGLAHLVRFVRPAPGMNFVAYSRLKSEMEAIISEQATYFSELEQPFSWHAYSSENDQANQAKLSRQFGKMTTLRSEAQVWGGDFAWLNRRLGEHMDVPNYLSVYVAYVGNQAACSGWVYFHPGSAFASLYGGATLRLPGARPVPGSGGAGAGGQ